MEQPLPDGSLLGEDGIVDLIEPCRTSDHPLDDLLEAALSVGAPSSFQDDLLVFWLQRHAEEIPETC
jgi:hypothetical protein